MIWQSTSQGNWFTGRPRAGATVYKEADQWYYKVDRNACSRSEGPFATEGEAIAAADKVYSKLGGTL